MGKTAVILLAACCALSFGAPAWACGCDAKAKKLSFTERAKKSSEKIAANAEKLKKKVAGN
ncbi:MAG: hypothetical protein HZA03_00200 [Nitrospinae bacterium]|nr:hypothetical protein [Nitrospinota bacterium]